MEQYTKNHLKDLLAILKRYVAQERSSYIIYTNDARFSRQSRYARRTSHQVLSRLVPCVRMLDKLLNQPTAGAYYKAAPQLLAAALIQCFIGKTRIPDHHGVWQVRINSDHLRALVALGPEAWQTWLSRQETQFSGITDTVCNSHVSDLRAMRSVYLARGCLMQSEQQARLKNVLERVKASLPPEDYLLLLENLRVPA